MGPLTWSPDELCFRRLFGPYLGANPTFVVAYGKKLGL
jgi:hypothetical protein